MSGLYPLGKPYKRLIEPLINLEISPQGEEVELLVDTGADLSRVSKLPKGCELSERVCKVKGAKGESFEVSVIKKVVIRRNSRESWCDLLYMPVLECSLLGRDLQVQLGVRVIPRGQMVAEVMLMREEDESEIDGGVWAEGGGRGLLDVPPMKVEMAQGISPIRVRQYPISAEERKGLTPVIRELIKDGILETCMCPHNTPVLPVKKPGGTYWLVQDLREVNKCPISRYPVVPNPYTLLSRIPSNHGWFSIIDLKDAFWAYLLAEESRNWFVFDGKIRIWGGNSSFGGPVYPKCSPNL